VIPLWYDARSILFTWW